MIIWKINLYQNPPLKYGKYGPLWLVLLSHFYAVLLVHLILKFAKFYFFFNTLIYFLSFSYINKKYQNQNYYLTKKSVIVEKGVFFKSTKEIPINKIVSSDITISPDEKFFNLCSLHLLTLNTKIIFSHIKCKSAINYRKIIMAEDKNEI